MEIMLASPPKFTIAYYLTDDYLECYEQMSLNDIETKLIPRLKGEPVATPEIQERLQTAIMQLESLVRSARQLLSNSYWIEISRAEKNC